MNEQEFVNEVYRRLQALLTKVKDSYEVDARVYYDLFSHDCEDEYRDLERAYDKPHNLVNLLLILRWLNARYPSGELKNNSNIDCQMREYREESGLTPEVVDNLIVIAGQFSASASAGEQKHAHSMFRTLVVKY